MQYLAERLRVLWVGLIALVVAFTLVLLAQLAQRDMAQKLGTLKEILGTDLTVIQLSRPIHVQELNQILLRLNEYHVAAISPIYEGEEGQSLRAIAGNMPGVDRFWLADGRWPDEGDAQSSLAVTVYAGAKEVPLGSWQPIANRRYKVIGRIDQKVAGFIFGEIGREMHLVAMNEITPSQRTMTTLLVRPIDNAVFRKDEIMDYFVKANLAPQSILAPSDMAAQSNRVQIQLTKGLWLMSVLLGAVAFSAVLSMLLRDVQDRRAEIGLRRALGASGSDIARMIVSEVAGLLFAAFLLALLIVIVVKKAYPQEWLSPPIFTGQSTWLIVGLFIVTLLLAYIPALRASRISPMQALR